MAHPARRHPASEWGVRFATADGMEHSIDGRWDLIVAHPPCTYLSNAGASRLYRVIDGETYIRRDRFEKGWLGREFFLRLLDCDCDRVCIENPTPSKCFHLPECTQVIEPYQFGHPYTKRTCLWLRGLPPLKPTSIVHPIGSWVQGNGEAWKKKKARGEIVTGGHKDPRIRAKTFPGIGLAMAEQWGGEIT